MLKGESLFYEVSLGEVADESVAQSGPVDPFVYIDIGSIDRESKIIVEPKTLSLEAAPSRAKQVLKEGDVLVSMTRPNLNAVAIVPSNLDSAIGSTGFHILRSKWVEPKFLYYLVQTDCFIDAMCSVVQGALYPAVRPRDISSFKFLLPSPLAQTHIVEKLEELLSDLDAGVAELKAAQKKLTQYRQSLLKAAVEGALTAEWRKKRNLSSVRPELVEGHVGSPVHPSTGSGRTGEPTRTKETETGTQLLDRILVERRQRWEEKQLAKFKEQGKTPLKGWQEKYPEPVKPNIANLPELPEGWVWATVDQLGDVQLGRQRSPDKLKGINPTRYMRAANITEQGVDFNDVLEMDFSSTERQTFALKAGNVLLTEASGSPEHVGRPVIWPEVEGLYCFQNTVIRFVPQGISSDFPFRIFQAWQKLGKFQQLSGGVGINHLSAGKFSGVAMPLPPLDEQDAVVQILSQAFSTSEEQVLAIEHALNQSAAQRKNILKSAFSGQLVPQDPHDEPASVLLERIRADRAARGASSKPPRQRKSKPVNKDSKA